MRVRPTWKVPTAKQAANFVSDFDRPSFGTLRHFADAFSRDIKEDVNRVSPVSGADLPSPARSTSYLQSAERGSSRDRARFSDSTSALKERPE